MTIYEDNGYKNRHHYICSMAEQYGVDEEAALLLADLLGPDEDFDGFVNSIQDLAEGYI